MDEIALAVAEVDPAELAAGLAGGVDVLHAVAVVDLRREQLGRRLDLPAEELSEEYRIIHDPLILLLRAGDADGLVAPSGLGRTFGRWHAPSRLRMDEIRGPQHTRPGLERLDA